MGKEKVSEADLLVGDEIFCRRSPVPYRHYGIYVGDGRVIHYSGEPGKGKKSGCVREVSVANFARGDQVFRKRYKAEKCLPIDTTIRLARNRLGETFYDLKNNNCQHFSRFCKTGKHESLQVKLAIRAGGALISVVVLAFANQANPVPLPNNRK
jgi:hypothetical protein